MTHQSKALPMLAILVALFLGAATQAKADPLAITITNAVQAGEPGSILFFRGNITNVSSAPVTFNSIAFLDPVFGLSFGVQGAMNFTNLFQGGPLSLLPTQSLNDIDLFALILVTPGTYSSTFLLGDYDGVSEFIVLGQAGFQYTIQDAPTPVPEPATILLLGTALTGITLKGRRRIR